MAHLGIFKKQVLVGSSILFSLSLILSITPRSASAAQVPVSGAYITWSAATYAPPSFTGKHLPTSGSSITAWVVMFDNGKPIDLSGATIYWYTDSQLLQSGQGVQRITFSAPNTTEQIINLQARVEDTSGNNSVANIQVPIVSPVTAIEANYPGLVISGSSANVLALPYFFNVSDPSTLNYSWQVNNVSAKSAENPQQATINIGNGFLPGSAVRINLTVSNSSDNTSADSFLKLTYQKL